MVYIFVYTYILVGVVYLLMEVEREGGRRTWWPNHRRWGTSFLFDIRAQQAEPNEVEVQQQMRPCYIDTATTVYLTVLVRCFIVIFSFLAKRHTHTHTQRRTETVGEREKRYIQTHSHKKGINRIKNYKNKEKYVHREMERNKRIRKDKDIEETDTHIYGREHV